MKTCIITFLLIFSSNSLAQDINLWQGDDKYKEAAKQTQKALLSYPVVKKANKKLEQKIYDKMPVSKETAGVIGSTVMTLSKGSVNTRVIKKMDIKMLGGRVRPDVDYNFKNGSTAGAVNMNWNF